MKTTVLLKQSQRKFGNMPGYVQGTADKSSTAKMLIESSFKERAPYQDWYRCEVCSGCLHEWHECPTKKKMDIIAKENDDCPNWGQWKYEQYYREFMVLAKNSAPTRQLACDQAKTLKSLMKSPVVIKPGFGIKDRRFGKAAYKRKKT